MRREIVWWEVLALTAIAIGALCLSYVAWKWFICSIAVCR